MGSKYKAICNSCQHQFNLVKGGGWTWYQKICNACGQELRVPRKGPEDFESGLTMTHQDLAKHLADSSKWSRRGGSFDNAELNMLSEMTSTCDCGGSMISEMSPDISYRCPRCKGININLGEYVLFD
jgi:Zn finger protein HypA/HybF involved in hydrogenase expression